VATPGSSCDAQAVARPGLHLVDTVVVEPDQLDGYLEVLRSQAIPLYQGAGATLEYLRTSDADVGEPVEVQLAWSVADNARWNEIRRTLVLDPLYYESAVALASLRLGGTRRFHRDTQIETTATP